MTDTAWHDAYSEDATVRVDFPDGTSKYLTMDGAIKRLEDQWLPDTTRRLLVQGEKMTRWTGAVYYLVDWTGERIGQ